MMDGYNIKSNRESGLGRSVLQLLSAPYDGIAIIMELKVADTYARSWWKRRRKRLYR